MNRLAVLFPVIALIAVTPILAPAQSPAVNINQSATLYAAPDSTGCPVGLRAQRAVTLGTVIVKDGPDGESVTQDGITQELHMTLTNSNPRQIIGLQITVHGFPAKARAVPVVSSPSDAELEKTIDLRLNIASHKQASTDLRLHAFTAVRLLDVDSVDYADGSSWHASAQQTCHIEPDGFMLVSSR